ncbi:conserved exported protein of unknown function [Xenorhabdus doucetiae]|uniref:Uncharacterized protein DUF1481 n=1 Tax=Xenorhabdus doucetiae TaxID=351671 RepID=A0A068QX13_9GAMM|nr:uncharacterized protein DUF1481 [Xenorhabdus doucetiae]CDG19294.1 conserved exported protein of unknown function [Xenorhabdus doucetiae]
MLILQGLLALGFVSLLSACSIQPTTPLFSASGFVTDSGVIRLWRLDDQNSRPQVIMSVYSPYYDNAYNDASYNNKNSRNKDTIVTFYEYRHGSLWQIRRNVFDNPPIVETLRIAQDDSVIFKLRQLQKRNEPLSDDDVARLKFDAKQIEKTSDALIADQVNLLQGHWQDGRVTTCAGKQLSIEFGSDAQKWLEERRNNSAGSLTIAWLNSSAGNKLLLVANDDFCRWEPTKDKL